jgi:hypothetical protein
VKAIAAITLVLLAVVVGIIAWHAATFDAYSRDFGSLSPAHFESLNARMNLLEKVARVSLLALATADIVLVVVAFRKRAFVAFGLGIALAIVLALFFLIAQAAVGPAMIGLSEAHPPSLVQNGVPEYSFCRGNDSYGGTDRGSSAHARSVELFVG